MGSLRQSPFTRINDVAFRVYTEKEIEKISVVHVTNEESFNTLGHYLDNGIYDILMGPMNPKDGDCKTCGNKFFKCSGHYGHIDLPLPVCNPFFLDVIKEILARVCPSCYRFQVKAQRGIQFVYECSLFNAGYSVQALEVASIVSQYMANPDEATEVKSSVNEKGGTARSGEILQTIIALEKKLKGMFKKLKKEEVPSKVVTCNTQSIYTQLQRSFLHDTRPNPKGICIYCSKRLMVLKFQNSQIMIKNWMKRRADEDEDELEEEEESSLDSKVAKSQPYLTPKQAQKVMQECYKKDGYVLKHLYPFMLDCDFENPVDAFFVQKLLVIPPRHRPTIVLNGMVVESEQSVLYKSVVRLCKCLRFMVQYMDKEPSQLPEALQFLLKEVDGATMLQKSHNVWHQLQGVVDNILDSEISPSLKVCQRGIRQVIEKKFGLFRRNLMGKRVDFSARSVAAPDAMLAVDEVGVPMDFALKLTYPVPVTHWNVPKLRKLVQNGPSTYPGALMVEDEEGRRVTLRDDDPGQRNAIARSLLTPVESCARRVNATKIVYRHLQSGDYVLMNRQPTLHKPSIQAHRALIMPRDRVLRLPYASCKAYNADFDGDELNLHFPQNEMARSEAHHLVTSRNQYLTPKDGSPLAGLIQDCVVASVMLTVRGKFFTAEDYQQLVYVAVGQLPRRIRTVPPAILKPTRLWSGKQVISTILLNLIPEGMALPTFQFKTAVKVELWQHREPKRWELGTPGRRKEWMTESEFIMQDGELLCGVVDKCAIGSTSYGLVHTCFELYGGMVASQLLTAISRLCIWYLQWSGHTISLKEFVTLPEAASRRRKDLKTLIENSEEEVKLKLDLSKETSLAEYVESLHKSENEKEMAAVDSAYTSVLGPSTSSITSENEKNLYRNNLQNRMRMMVDTGAKGSKVNMNQMASLFGSVAIDGKRMPMSVTGKTLPAFKPYETNPTAGGYIPTRFVTGMDPKSYFFLCIVGRDSLQHTAVKTANSGYMQRCLIKHLEGIHVKYDMTVRNNDGVVLQFQYGEDGLDVSKVPFLKNVDSIDYLIDNYRRCLRKKDIDIAMGLELPQLKTYKKLAAKYRSKTRKGKRNSAFLRFCKDHKSDEMVNPLSIDWSNGRTAEATKLTSLWNNLDPKQKVSYQSLDEKLERGRDPVSSLYSGASNFGVVSEALDALIDEYYNEKYMQRRSEERLSKKEVSNTLYMKALNSRADPGEAVGALCAQAIGEPLTQMTLNTFHFAGRDELNVTLGVPRMIEILRSASEKINTPIMEVPFKAHVTPALAERLRVKLTPVILDKVINSVTIWTSLEKGMKFYTRTDIQFNFLPHRKYKKTYFVRPSDVLDYMEKIFFRKVLIAAIKTALKKVSASGVGWHVDRKRGDKEDEDEEVVEPSSQSRGLGEENDSEEEEEERQGQQNEDVGISSASRQKKMKEMDYSEDEEEEDDIENKVFGGDLPPEEQDSDSEKKCKRKPVNPIDDILGSEDEGLGDEVDLPSTTVGEVENEMPPEDEKTTKTQAKKENRPSEGFCQEDMDYLLRKNRVIGQDSWIVDYDYDREDLLWCTVSLDLPLPEGRYDLANILQETTKHTLLHSIRGVKKALVVPKGEGLLLRTEGVNIQALFVYENILDINRLYTNNIRLMAQIYGIEAAQRCVIREIREVQSAYDIKVDFRHLSLLADYFTCEGVYKACSRHAMTTCSSPIQKMSYETCFNFLKKALIQGLPDNMSSPSANVMVGQPVKMGTNSVDILSKLVDAY